jgi:hypothetical protein
LQVLSANAVKKKLIIVVAVVSLKLLTKRRYKATSSNIDSRIVTDILPVKVSLIDLSKTTSQLTLVLVANAPPPDPLNRLYIANCVFRV